MTIGRVLEPPMGFGVDATDHATSLAAQPLLMVRILGPLIVQRPDGSLVDRAEWRTGKVIDLLRLLALADGEPVATKKLVASLWPGSDQQRGNASLRTAVSQVRRIIGCDQIERSLSGLRLRHSWVDVSNFRHLATEAHRFAGLGRYDSVRRVARQADALYRGDFGAHDDGAEWVQTERRDLCAAHQTLLCDAAEAAILLGLGREGVDFALRATTVDPYSERATRLLMRAHAAAGEISCALREFERCRLLLADELGIDPSPPTRELYLTLLRSEGADTATDVTVRGDNSAGPRAATRVRAISSRDAGGRLREALEEALPQRDFDRARDLADQVLAMDPTPALAARALTVRSLPGILLGDARSTVEQLARASTLAAESGDDVLYRRFEVLQCLASHDLSDSHFARRWALTARQCGDDSEVNSAWLMMRIATERGDLATAQVAGRLPTTAGVGVLEVHLHHLAVASLMAALGERRAAVQSLSTLLDVLDRTGSRLLLPETLARLIAQQAPDDVVEAEAGLARLDREIAGTAFPREAHLRMIGLAAIHAAHGRIAAAAAAAAGAAEVADSAGLISLAADAHRICGEHTSRAQAIASTRRDAEPLRLSLRMVAV